jgi:hypothetical protein
MSMMSRKKLQKKKDREKVVKKRILNRRAAIRAPKIEENKNRKKMERIAKLQKDMNDLSVWADDVLGKLDSKTLTQLERNAQLLKGLEEEYEAERAKKSELNGDLESKGLLSLDEKLNHLHQNFAQSQRNSKEVAEVTICRAEENVDESASNEEDSDLKEEN